MSISPRHYRAAYSNGWIILMYILMWWCIILEFNDKLSLSIEEWEFEIIFSENITFRYILLVISVMYIVYYITVFFFFNFNIWYIFLISWSFVEDIHSKFWQWKLYRYLYRLGIGKFISFVDNCFFFLCSIWKKIYCIKI